MLLPHGYEGQGPEHSSARLERFLQLCAEENVFVANCTTPASFFHLLRRQALQPLRKPLVVMSPKSLLRHPECVSSLDELAQGRFEPLLVDREVSDPRRLVFCSGKIYFELRAARAALGATDVALLRLEQLYPFPAAQIREVLAAHPQAEVVWCQEEPRNMGAWPILDEWFAELLDGRAPRYVGRLRAAAPATGSPRKHRKEQDALLAEALR
jgi:2-oxoglutarate dehydrogenase E1 component